MALVPSETSDSTVKNMVGATPPSLSLGEMMAQRTAALKPYKEDVEEKTKKASEFEAKKGLFEQEQKMRTAGAKYAALTAAQQKAEKAYEPVEDLEEDMLNAKFVPTQESARDLAALYGLIGVVGWAIGSGGKGNAMRAMSAQNGMLEGYQKGRADLYKKEKDLFETNIKALREKAKIVSEKAKRVAELAAKDPQAAAELSAYISAQEGAEFYKQNAEKFGYAKAAKDAEDSFKAADKMYLEIIKEYARAAKRTGKPQTMKGSDGKLYMVYSEDDIRPVQTPEGVTLTKPTVEKTAKGASTKGASGAGGAVQFRYNQAMTNAGNQLANEIENAASLPVSATPPVLAEVLTDPSKGLTDAGKRFFSQKITDEEARAFQQVFAGMTRAITTIEASGRPSGATEGAIREFAKSQPRAGDKKINIYLSLAQSKQVMDILVKDLKAAQANSTQIAQAEEAKKRVDSLITWTVKDVNRILASGKSTLVDPKVQDAMKTSKTLGELNKQVKPSSAKQYATEADAEKAFKEGTLKSGDKVIINGQSGTWE